MHRPARPGRVVAVACKPQKSLADREAFCLSNAAPASVGFGQLFEDVWIFQRRDVLRDGLAFGNGAQ